MRLAAHGVEGGVEARVGLSRLVGLLNHVGFLRHLEIILNLLRGLVRAATQIDSFGLNRTESILSFPNCLLNTTDNPVNARLSQNGFALIVEPLTLDTVLELISDVSTVSSLVHRKVCLLEFEHFPFCNAWRDQKLAFGIWQQWRV